MKIMKINESILKAVCESISDDFVETNDKPFTLPTKVSNLNLVATDELLFGDFDAETITQEQFDKLSDKKIRDGIIGDKSLPTQAFGKDIAYNNIKKLNPSNVQLVKDKWGDNEHVKFDLEGELGDVLIFIALCADPQLSNFNVNAKVKEAIRNAGPLSKSDKFVITKIFLNKIFDL